MFVDAVDHMNLLGMGKSKAYDDMKTCREALELKARKWPTLVEYCDYFQLDPEYVTFKLGIEE